MDQAASRRPPRRSSPERAAGRRDVGRAATGDPRSASPAMGRLARPARRGDRREPDRRPPAAPGARGDPLRQPRRPSATASAGRATSTTSPPTPRSSSRPNYDGLAAGLLAAIGAVGGDALIEQIFQARRRQSGERVRRQLDERVEPGRAASSSGSRPSRRSRTSRATSPTRSSSPTARSASGSTTARSSTSPGASRRRATPSSTLFRDVLGADVVRETHIVWGDRCCSYRITRGEADARADRRLGLLALDRDARRGLEARRRARRRRSGRRTPRATSPPRSPGPRRSGSRAGPSDAISSRMYVLSISGPSVLIVNRTSLRRSVSKIQRNSSQPETTRVLRFELGQISRTIPRSRIIASARGS